MRNVFGPHHFRPAPEPMAVSPDLFSGYGRWKEDGTSDMFTPAYQFTFFGLNGIEISMDN